MRTLAIDIETFSSADLRKCGVYKYVQSLDFEVLMFAYAFDNDDVQIVDLAGGEELPDEVLLALTDRRVRKTAHNANFERVCIQRYFDIELPVQQWDCTLVLSAMTGLPLDLDTVAKVLGLAEKKDAEGKALIKYFSIPCRPTKVNGQRVRNLPRHDPERWESYKSYCVQDVVVERSIRHKIEVYKIMPKERQLWVLDQHINDTGIAIDKHFVLQAMTIDQQNREELTAEAIAITNLKNPNSVAQLKDWLNEELKDDEEEDLSFMYSIDGQIEAKDPTITTLRKDVIIELLKTLGVDKNNVRRVLEIRQEISKTSIKKYATMLNSLCDDGRVRGLLQFYGANRTGRWAGRLIQVHNLVKNSHEDLAAIRNYVRAGDIDALQMLYGSISDLLSQLIRTAFVANPGHRLIVSDFAAIEARIISWLAGEKWRLEVFATHGRIYEASAAAMYNVPMETVMKGGKNYRLRAIGKIAELALGFQGAVNALLKMDYKKELNPDDLPQIVKTWRRANKKIVQMWYDIQEVAIRAAETRRPVRYNHGIVFETEDDMLFIKLPSGRRLAYVRPRLKQGRYGLVLSYEGMNQTTKKWHRMETYGGKLVENIVQGIARDCLAEGLDRANDAGYLIAMHVHDEIVSEMPDGVGSLEELTGLMGIPVSWAPGIPLKAEGFETLYYKKD